MTFTRVVLRAAGQTAGWLTVLGGGAFVAWLGFVIGGGWR